MAAVELSAKALRQVLKELKELSEKPPEGVKVLINEERVADVQGEIEGPVGTPFEGGIFRMKLVLPADFPASPPRGFFLTKIFHPNVAEAGDICVNTLKRDWDPNHGLRHIFEVIRCLLIEPFPESALNEEAGKLLIEDYKGYEQRAKLMTGIYAKPPKAAPAKMPLTTSNTANSGEGAAGAAEKGKEATSAPAKKAGGAQKGKALLRKKSSLKRL
jgi:ubiquitin-conjugating enzyme E2 S